MWFVYALEEAERENDEEGKEYRMLENKLSVGNLLEW